MKNLYYRIQQNALLRGVLYLLVGLLTALAPRQVFDLAVYIAAGCFFLSGLITLLNSWRKRHDARRVGAPKYPGLFQIAIAVLILLFAKPIISALPFFIGLIILLIGVSFVLRSLAAVRGFGSGFGWLIFSIVIVLCGLYLMLNPFHSVLAVLRITGLLLILLGISEFAASRSVQ